MILERKKASNRPDQKCPLCGAMQESLVAGTIPHESDPTKMYIDLSRGYSFCNCRNIWFTSWDNMKQEVYDDKYTDKYSDAYVDAALTRYFVYGQIVKKYFETGRMLELGCINPALLSKYRDVGWHTTALDIIKHDFEGHDNISANFETWNTESKFDFIHASHIFEHFKDPIGAVKKCNQLLNDGGLLFVSMPDPYFIDLKHLHKWGHWHLNEHHIMWDMESFCEVLEEQGFEILMKKHNIETWFICNSDQHILARKK